MTDVVELPIGYRHRDDKHHAWNAVFNSIARRYIKGYRIIDVDENFDFELICKHLDDYWIHDVLCRDEKWYPQLLSAAQKEYSKRMEKLLLGADGE